MLCKCTYFHYVDGVLVCTQCGKPAHGEQVEDKIDKSPVQTKKKK